MRVVPWLAVCLVACSASRAESAQTFLAEYRALACASAPACPAGIVQSIGAHVAADPSVCDRLAPTATDYPLDVVARGDAEFVPEEAEACLAELRAGGCAQALLFNWFANPRSCMRAFRPVLAGVGEPCGRRFCGDGLYCPSETCAATCMPETPVGTPCSSSGTCLGAEVCADGACARVGGTTGDAHLGETCFTLLVSKRCIDPGTVCAGTTCVAIVRTGETCTDTGACPSTDWCDAVTHVCTPIPITSTAGAACAFDIAHATTATPICNELDGLVCGGLGVCGPTAGTRAPRPAGASCSDGSACESRHCLISSGTCC